MGVLHGIFLDGRVVEIDYDKNLFIVHSSLQEIPNGYSKFDMDFDQSFFHITGNLLVNEKKISGRFLFDGGYQRSILLDPHLMKEEGYPDSLDIYKTTNLTNSQAEVFVTKIFRADVDLDGLSLTDIPVQVMPDNLENPAGFHTHFFGNELLKRFNTILDLQNHLIYLKPNSLWEAGYVDAG